MSTSNVSDFEKIFRVLLKVELYSLQFVTVNFPHCIILNTIALARLRREDVK